MSNSETSGQVNVHSEVYAKELIIYGVPGLTLRFVLVQVFVFSHSYDGGVDCLG